MLYMLLICYDPVALPIASEQNLQPERHKLELELHERRLFVSGTCLWS